MEVYYDSFQEGMWFKGLHYRLHGAILCPFPSGNSGPEYLKRALLYDRPDIIVVDNDQPILVLERTVEVPSGHNVGQRFARLVAAAEMCVPIVYFGPYAAYKHGGVTQGPRYMNLRLFYALKKLGEIEHTAVTTINWPVDQNYEIIQTPAVRDERMKAYMGLFFKLYDAYGVPAMAEYIMNSAFQGEQEAEQSSFISESVVRPEQYDSPPESVKILPWQSIPILAAEHPRNLRSPETVFYRIGMTYIRSDPYTGMAMLYLYLYCGGLENRTRDLVLHFPYITKEQWHTAASHGDRKDIRLFRFAADGILFSDGYLPKGQF